MKLQHEFFLQAVADSQYLTDGVCEEDFCLFLRVLKQDEGLLTEGPLQNIQKDFQEKKPITLKDFTDIVDSTLKKLEFQSSFAFCACLLVEDRIYILSRGLGGVFLFQSGSVNRLIMGEQNASGRLNDDGLLILGSYDVDFKKSDIDSFFSAGEDFDNKMTEIFGAVDIGGFVAIRLLSTAPQTAIITPPQENKLALSDLKTDSLTDNGNLPLKLKSSKKKTITILASVLIVLILIWSVVFGYQRRTRHEILSQAKQIQPQIESKILDAKEAVEFDPHEAKKLANEAEIIFDPIWKKAKKNNLINERDIKVTHDSIQSVFSEIEKVNNRKPEEFYDLFLLGKNVKIDKFMQSGIDAIGFLDKENKKIHQITTEKKSIKTFSFKEVENATMGFIDKNRTFFLTTKGIYMGDDKLTNVIKNESWGKIIDITTFNGNIYVLDSQNDEVYKYLVVDEATFSGKNSYFKQGQSTNLDKAVSFAVDGAFYIGFEDGSIVKYLSGIKENFRIKPPRSISISKLMTNIDTSNLYVFDKKQGAVFVFSKNGDFKKEISSKYLKKASNIALISNDTIVFQIGSLVYLLK